MAASILGFTTFVEDFEDQREKNITLEPEQTKSKTWTIRNLFNRKSTNEKTIENAPNLLLPTQSAFLEMQKVLVSPGQLTAPQLETPRQEILVPPVDTSSARSSYHSVQSHISEQEVDSSRLTTLRPSTPTPNREMPVWEATPWHSSKKSISLAVVGIGRPVSAPSSFHPAPQLSLTKSPSNVNVEEVRNRILSADHHRNIVRFDVTIGDIKSMIASRLKLPLPASVKLVINGRLLNNDSRSAYAAKNQWGNIPFSCRVSTEYLVRLQDEQLRGYGLERSDLRGPFTPLAVHLTDDGSVILTKKNTNLSRHAESVGVRSAPSSPIRRSLAVQPIPLQRRSEEQLHAAALQDTLQVADHLRRIDNTSAPNNTDIIINFRIESGSHAGQFWQSASAEILWTSGQLRLGYLKRHILRQFSDISQPEAIELRHSNGLVEEVLENMDLLQSWFRTSTTPNDIDSGKGLRRSVSINVRIRDQVVFEFPFRNWPEHVYFKEGSINDGSLTIGHIRRKAQRALNAPLIQMHNAGERAEQNCNGSATQTIRMLLDTQVLEPDDAPARNFKLYSSGISRIKVQITDIGPVPFPAQTPQPAPGHQELDYLLDFDDTPHPAPPSVDQLTPTRKGLRARDCAVCGDTCAPFDFPGQISPQCTHKSSTCTDCMQTWIASELESKGWDKIRCPECPTLLQHSEVLALATSETFERFDALATRALLSSDPDFHFCLSSTCASGQIHPSLCSNPIMTCVSCHVSWCLAHKIPWHAGETCAAYDSRLSSEANAKVLAAQRAKEESESEAKIKETAQQCPGRGCGRWIEKNDGCDHMTCTKCGWQFCWLCLCDYDFVRVEGNHWHERECPHWRAEGNRGRRRY